MQTWPDPPAVAGRGNRRVRDFRVQVSLGRPGPLRFHPGPFAAGEVDRVEEHAAHGRADLPAHLGMNGPDTGHVQRHMPADLHRRGAVAGPERGTSRDTELPNCPGAVHSAMNPQVDKSRTFTSILYTFCDRMLAPFSTFTRPARRAFQA